MRDRSDVQGTDAGKARRNAQRHRRSTEGRGAERVTDANALGNQTDEYAAEAASAVNYHLEQANNLDRGDRDERVAEAEHLARDLATRGDGSTRTVRQRARAMDALLERADTSGSPESGSHVDAARQVVRDLLWWLKG